MIMKINNEFEELYFNVTEDEARVIQKFLNIKAIDEALIEEETHVDFLTDIKIKEF